MGCNVALDRNFARRSVFLTGYTDDPDGEFVDGVTLLTVPSRLLLQAYLSVLPRLGHRRLTFLTHSLASPS